MIRLELSEQGKKLLEREREHLEKHAHETWSTVRSPGAALSATCKFINARARYFAITGEHISILDLEGLTIVDGLDEQLVKLLQENLKKYVDSEHRNVNAQAAILINEGLGSSTTELPRYPVAYRVLYVLQKAFMAFKGIVDSNRGFNVDDMELAFVQFILGLADHYVQTRTKPQVRHFSDVAREYDVVSRMRCKCGTDQFQVKMQSLMQMPDGAPYDRLDLECKGCGHQRTVTFDLPHFKDLSQV